MSFENKEIDDEKLLEEIDKLDDNYNSTVISSSEGNNDDVIESKDNTKKNIIFIVLLVFVLSAYVLYDNVFKKMFTSDIADDYVKEYYPIDEYDEYDDTEYDYSLDNYYSDDYWDREESREELRRDNFEKLKDNIKITYINVDEDGDVVLKLENNNDEPIYNFGVYAIFYDNSNKPIAIKQEIVDYVEAGKTYYLMYYLYNKEFSKVDTLVDKEFFFDEEPNNLAANIEYDVIESNDSIAVKGKNAGKKAIDTLLFQVVFYDKQGNIVGVDSSYEYDLSKNEGFKIILDKPYNLETYDSIDYSTYELELVYAMEKVSY